MTTRVKGFGLGALALLAVALPAAAAVYAPIADDELLRRSPVVVVASSLGSRPGTDTTRWPEMVTRFSLVESLKGSAATEIDVAVPGGPLPNGLWLHVPDVPSFLPGAQYLLFLRPRADGTYGVSELSLGSFDVVQSQGGKKYATRKAFRGATRPGAFVKTVDGVRTTQAEPLRDLKSFGAWVRSGAADAVNYLRADIQGPLVPVAGGPTPNWNSSWGPSGTAFRWNGTPTASVSVRNEVPSYGGQSGVAGSGGGLVYEFGNAIGWWKDNSSSTIAYTRGTDSTGTYDPANLPGPGAVLVYANNISQFGGTPVTACDGTYSGVLAIGAVLTDMGTHTYKGFTWTNVLAGIGWVREILCTPGSVKSNDFENMMTAVLGNTLGLSNNPQARHAADVIPGDESYAVMNVTFNGTRPPGLGSDDQDAVCFMYGACDPLKPPTNPPVAAFMPPPLPMTKGVAGIFNDTSTGSPTSWSWNFGDGSALVTTRSPAYAFGKVGDFSVQLLVTNSAGSSSLSWPVAVKTNMVGGLKVTSAPAGQPSTLTVTLTQGVAQRASFDFGDGSSPTVVSSRGTTFTTTHTYTQYGVFSPYTRLTDGDLQQGIGVASPDLTDILVSGVATTYPSPCETLPPPTLTAPLTAPPGQDIVLSWTAADGFIEALDDYQLEIDRSNTFGTAVKTVYTSKVPSFTVPVSNPVANSVGQTLYARLRIVKGCGQPVPGTFSNITETAIVAPVPIVNVSVVSTPPPGLHVVGTPPPVFGQVAYMNSPTSTASAAMSLSTGSGTQFFAADPSVFSLAPGETRQVTVIWLQPFLETPGLYSGALGAQWATGSLSTPVSLSVLSAPPVPPANVTLTTSSQSVAFEMPAGQTPAPQTITATVTPAPGATNIWYLSRDSVPGWLSVVGSCSESPTACAALQFPPNGTITLTLTVDRSRRAPSDTPPLVTGLLGLSVLSASPAAIVTVGITDNEPLGSKSDPLQSVRNPGPGINATKPAGGSFVVPTVTLGKGLFDATFTSNGWVKNVSSASAPLKIYFIPEGKNGTTDPGTLSVETTVKAGTAIALTDVLATYFGLASGNGRLEIRSSVPQALSVRSYVEAVTGNDPAKRFGVEIPISAWGAGTALGQGPLVIPAIAENANSRANLILTETSGDQATVEITLYDAVGTVVGTLPGQVVLPYSKIQIQRIVEMVKPGTTLEVGSISVRVSAGSGRVIALATVVDNRSNSFSAIEGRAVNIPGAPASYVIPAAARLIGAYDTYFRTNLNLSNGTSEPATVKLTFRYVDQDEADLVRTVTKSVTLPGHASLAAALATDAIKNLFEITHRVYGWISIEGDAPKIVAAASNSALVDPNDATKGEKASQVPPVPINSQQVVGMANGGVRFPGTEKSVEKRTNAMFVEVTGKPVNVRLTATDAGGSVLATKNLTVAANQYLQLTDVFGPQGFNLGAGPFFQIELSAQVLSGEGKIISFVTVIDNKARSPQLYLLLPPGPPS